MIWHRVNANAKGGLPFGQDDDCVVDKSNRGMKRGKRAPSVLRVELGRAHPPAHIELYAQSSESPHIAVTTSKRLAHVSRPLLFVVP